MKKFVIYSALLTAFIIPQFLFAAGKVPVPLWSPKRALPIKKLLKSPDSRNTLIQEGDSIYKFLRFKTRDSSAAELIALQGITEANIDNYGIGVLMGSSKIFDPEFNSINENRYQIYANFIDARRCHQDFRIFDFYRAPVCKSTSSKNYPYVVLSVIDPDTAYSYIDNMYNDSISIIKFPLIWIGETKLFSFGAVTADDGTLCPVFYAYQKKGIIYYTYNPTTRSFKKIYFAKTPFISQMTRDGYILSFSYSGYYFSLKSINSRTMTPITNSNGNDETEFYMPAVLPYAVYEEQHIVKFNGIDGGWDYHTNEWDKNFIAPNETGGDALSGSDWVLDVVDGDSTVLEYLNDGKNSIFRCEYKNSKITNNYNLIYSEDGNNWLDGKIFRIGDDYICSQQSNQFKYMLKRGNETSVIANAVKYYKYFYDIRTGKLTARYTFIDSSNSGVHPDTTLPWGDGTALIVTGYTGEKFFNNGGENDFGVRGIVFDYKHNIAIDTLYFTNYSEDSLKFNSFSGDKRLILYSDNRNIKNDSARQSTFYLRTFDGQKQIVFGAPHKHHINTDNYYYMDIKLISTYAYDFKRITDDLYKIGLEYFYLCTSFSDNIVYKSEDADYWYYKDSVYNNISDIPLPIDTALKDKIIKVLQGKYSISPSGKYLLCTDTADGTINSTLYSIHGNEIDSSAEFSFANPFAADSVQIKIELVSDSVIKYFGNYLLNISDPKNIFGSRYWVGDVTMIDNDYFIGEQNIIYKWTDSAYASVPRSAEILGSKCSFSIYPTPANDLLNVNANQIETSGFFTGKIVNLRGETMRIINSQSPEFSISTTDFPVGVYFIEIDNPQRGRTEFRMFNIVR